MSNEETRLFSTLLEVGVGVEELDLEDLYSERMGGDGDPRRHPSVAAVVDDEDAFSTDMTHLRHTSPDHHRSAGGEGLHHHLEKENDADMLASAFNRRASSAGAEIKFINTFFSETPRGSEYMLGHQMAGCAHEDDVEVQEEVADQFEDWSQYTPSLVSPENYLSLSSSARGGPIASSSASPSVGNDGLEIVYEEMKAHINRRFSLAAISSGGAGSNGLVAPVPSRTLPPLTGNPIQFVMEDPSGKNVGSQRDINNFVISPLEPGRRHSMGGAPHLYCCPWTGCNKVFNRFYNLRSHYRIHSGERPYTCNYCDASFARNHDLKRHERIHLKTKPFVCPTCNKGFSRNDAMNRHVRLKSCTRASIS